MNAYLNLNTEIVDQVFSMTGFNYDIHIDDNGDGTSVVAFDSPKDAEKFEKLYSELADQPNPSPD